MCVILFLRYREAKRIQDAHLEKQEQAKADIECKIQELSVKKAHLEEQLNARKDTVAAAQSKISDINSQYQREKQHVDNLKQIAESQKQQMQEEFDAQKAAHEQEFAEYIKSIQEKKELVQKELASLAATREAVIETWRKEEEAAADRDFYRLDVTDAQAQDVNLLQNIRVKFSNPRVISKLIWQTYYQPLAKKKFPLILGASQITGIYKITNNLDHRVYIGQAVDVHKRWNEHCKCACGIDCPSGNKLYAAMQKDGIENFTFELLEECSREELNQKETFYINLYQSVSYGYNSQNGSGF